ncbi:MAG: cytochrome c3 family protein [Candidatus Latescibacterota bacterium]|nr:MAG: cytochrome c3 family protein [Candidatus Latescibacterota bacterium]
MSHRASLVGILFLSLLPLHVHAADNETCFDCHSDSDLTKRRRGKTISLYVDETVFGRSVHRELECIDCHEDADVEDFPHEETLEKVYCGTCHDDVQLDFDTSIHGQALKRNAPYAPTCMDCHGIHDILSPRKVNSIAYKMKVPYLCGGCHQEGAPVARVYDIGEHNIIENYSQSIHGEGLFEKGLIVTATCTNCHHSHLILPHTDPRASISPRNIATTCMQCHSRIEDVHEKVIRGELWEKEPGAIPACTDCHLPHKARKETVALTISDRDCLKCHEEPDIFKIEEGDTISLTVDKSELNHSVHQNIPCVKCHSDIDPRIHRPCEPSGRVDCSNCHARISEEYFASGHGKDYLNNVSEAPYCTTCHSDHDVKSHRDDTASTFRASVPTLCGDCHRAEGKAPRVAELTQVTAYTDYSTSVHGRGLTEKGLLPSAICIDCHGSHLVLEHTDIRSTVHSNNIPATCASCHRGIYKQFIKSVHYSADETKSEGLPNCTDCHSSHTIGPVERDQFMTEVTHQCGSCHTHLSETYLETMHGKAYQLGYLRSAKCSDCHGAHEILAGDNPNSTVGFRNIVETCRKCHDDANMRFTGYLTHATHHDPVKYPILFYTYWTMTLLLIGVFTFFGIHTLLWLPRSFRQMKERKSLAKEGPRYFIRRFNRTQRITHIFVIVSFVSLALTGMMLKFSAMPWAQALASLLGGVRAAGNIHRIAATITFGYFIFHVMSLIRLKWKRRISWRELVFSENSMMFNKKDTRDFFGTLKWFFGRGPRPQYGRWTYWEKFDYFAVFWGVAVIGLSGLMLWFPEFFTKFIPGSLINVATIVHSDEALLAVGFIFTIHFFNTHLRPEAFPMDTVVFTGVVPVEEYKNDRPREYLRLIESGEIKRRVLKKVISKRRKIVIRIFGYTILGLGIILIGLIIYSVLFGYK